jgi:large subunit ribosomal protein L24
VQTTLLGLAIACILALLAALVGPHFVNWSDHRAFFEAEATRLIGLRTRVSGPIDVRILPFPSVTLAGIEIGPEGKESRMRASTLRMELALAPLMRGEIRAVEMRLVKPEFSIGLNSLGQIDWPAMALGGETLSIDRLQIVDGRATLIDSLSNSRMVLDQLQFTGEVRSLTGPFRGKGAFVNAGNAYGYTLSAGRYSSDGVRVRLALNTDERPLTIEADGTLAFDSAMPSFGGSLVLARPAGAVSPSGKLMPQEPWRLTAQVQAGPKSALLEKVAFQYGPDDRAAKLDGSAEIKFGEQPRLEGALSARQLDLDRLLATPEKPRRLPFAAVQALGELLGGALRPSFPTVLRVGVDAVTVGGSALQGVGGDLHSDGIAWYLDKLEFRAPGFSQVRLRGRLDPVGQGLGFSGAASVEASDPGMLLSWLAGRPGQAAPIRPWQAKGEVTLSADRIAVERLVSEFDRGRIEGRLAYLWPSVARPARLDAELSAGELDLDAVLGFSKSAFTGLGLEWPRELSLALDVGRARFAGLEAQAAKAKLKLDADGVSIERLTIGDFGGAGISASGRIQTTTSPGGNIAIDLDARELGGILTLAEKFAPPLAEPLRRLAGGQKTAKLRANVSLQSSGAGRANGRLDLSGQIGAIKTTLAALAVGSAEHFTVGNLGALGEADVRLDGKFESDDGAALLALVGLDRVTVTDKRPSRLSLQAKGAPGRELEFSGALRAGPIDAEGKGTLRFASDQPARLSLHQVAGTVGGSPIRGTLAMTFDAATQVEGSIETQSLDVPATLAALIGMPIAREGEAAWSAEPFVSRASMLAGRITFKADQAAFSPKFTVSKLKGVAQFGPRDISFDDIEGEMAKGHLSGRLRFVNGANGQSARARIVLKDAEAAELFASAGATRIGGRLQFSAEVEGAGRSPAAFIGSLAGNGTIALDGGQFGGLNPRVFDAVIRAVDIGISTDNARVREFVNSALDTATLPVAHAEAAIAISAGQARLGNIVVHSSDAKLEATASLDLTDGTLDALLTLNGAPQTTGGLHPSVLIAFKGPLLQPKRAVDTSLLASWLALRAVEQQAKQLDAMEKARADMAPPTASVPVPQSVAAPPVAAAPAPQAAAAAVAAAPAPSAAAVPAPAVASAPAKPVQQASTDAMSVAPATAFSAVEPPANAQPAPPLQQVTIPALPRPRPAARIDRAPPIPAARPKTLPGPLKLLGAQN